MMAQTPQVQHPYCVQAAFREAHPKPVMLHPEPLNTLPVVSIPPCQHRQAHL